METPNIVRRQKYTQKFEVGAVLRGEFRRMLLLKTNLEFKEHKFFLSSIFTVTAVGDRQSKELKAVSRMVNRISREEG